MDMDQVRTFLEVVEARSFVRAAESLNVTQSTVSARIKDLEIRLGQPLFQRRKSGVTLTTAGRRFQAVGANPRAAWMAGLRVRTHVVFAYTAAGLLYSVAAILLAGVRISIDPAFGASYSTNATRMGGMSAAVGSL